MAREWTKSLLRKHRRIGIAIARNLPRYGDFPVYTVTNHTPRRKLAAGPDHD